MATGIGGAPGGAPGGVKAGNTKKKKAIVKALRNKPKPKQSGY